MNPFDDLTVPALPEPRVDRIRRRGRHRLAHPEAGRARPGEVLLVSVFSVAMLGWGVASVWISTG